jgi:hypothetical protein
MLKSQLIKRTQIKEHFREKQSEFVHLTNYLPAVTLKGLVLTKYFKLLISIPYCSI